MSFKKYLISSSVPGLCLSPALLEPIVQTGVPSLVQRPAPHGTPWYSGKQEAKGTGSHSLDLSWKGSHGPNMGNTLWEISPFSHITTCPQSLLIFATGADILPIVCWGAFPLWNPSLFYELFGRKLSCTHLPLAASPFRWWRKGDTSDINRSKSPYSEKTSLQGGQREARVT